MSPDWRKNTQHESNPPEWEVTDVVDGFAFVVVYFNHHDIKNGVRKEMPSNRIGYLYEFQVGYGVDEAAATDDIQSRLGDKYTPADLVALLETS